MSNSDTTPDLPTTEPITAPARPAYNGVYDRLRGKVTTWARRKGQLGTKTTEALLALPDFFQLLCGLSLDPDVPPKQKAKLALAIGYVVSPIDLLPEVLFGPLAHLDDLVVIVFVLNKLLNSVPEDVLLRHWRGEDDLIKQLSHLIAVADELVGAGLLRRIGRFLAS